MERPSWTHELGYDCWTLQPFWPISPWGLGKVQAIKSFSIWCQTFEIHMKNHEKSALRHPNYPHARIHIHLHPHLVTPIPYIYTHTHIQTNSNPLGFPCGARRNKNNWSLRHPCESTTPSLALCSTIMHRGPCDP